jgi:hypothetical protein
VPMARSVRPRSALKRRRVAAVGGGGGGCQWVVSVGKGPGVISRKVGSGPFLRTRGEDGDGRHAIVAASAPVIAHAREPRLALALYRRHYQR